MTSSKETFLWGLVALTPHWSSATIPLESNPPKTNRDVPARVFPRLALLTYIRFKFWLVHYVVYVCCDWLERWVCCWFHDISQLLRDSCFFSVVCTSFKELFVSRSGESLNCFTYWWLWPRPTSIILTRTCAIDWEGWCWFSWFNWKIKSSGTPGWLVRTAKTGSEKVFHFSSNAD